ncbi:hypothetical protein V8G54_013863 [Vigna mungo]|uniref:Protein kinase domain-containing protein n=1 Tax=Vigna mungo TaxID=3915 RepID=A0AAQ3RY34_VIGMU
MFVHHRTNLVIVLTILIACTARAQNLTCNRQCGKQSVQFPFGFSEGCQIILNCSDNKVHLHEFLVQNVTNSNILVNLPAKCNRSMESIEPLFGNNFAPSVNNSFLVKDCSDASRGCVIPATNFVETCGNKSSNISCFSKQDEAGVLTYKDLKETKCNYLFSAIYFGQSKEITLQFQVVELAWWLQGQCDECSENATCSKVQRGFRCQCIHGFTGDGFINGTGCRKTSASSCSASTLASGGCGKATKIGVAVGASIAGALVVAGLFLLCYYARRRSIWLGKHTRVKRQLREAAGNSSIPFYPYKEVEKATNSFSEKHRLGTGAFGTVYAGKLHSDEWVAIKKLRQRDTNSADQVMNEIKLLSSVSHPNLVRLLGCCIEKGEQILVYEYMQNGTLSQHLQRERSEGLPWTVAELAFRCLAFHSDMRPTMTEVAEELEHIKRSGWATMEETAMTSSNGSTCSSPRNGSEKSLSGIKKAGQGSSRSIVPQKIERFFHSVEVKDSSPVSVHDPIHWSSGHSSPSSNSLLVNVIP